MENRVIGLDKEISLAEAMADFEKLYNKASSEPIAITEQGTPKMVMMSVDDYKHLRRSDDDNNAEIRRLMREIGEEAARNGMTEEILAEILKDENH